MLVQKKIMNFVKTITYSENENDAKEKTMIFMPYWHMMRLNNTADENKVLTEKMNELLQFEKTSDGFRIRINKLSPYPILVVAKNDIESTVTFFDYKVKPTITTMFYTKFILNGERLKNIISDKNGLIYEEK